MNFRVKITLFQSQSWVFFAKIFVISVTIFALNTMASASSVILQAAQKIPKLFDREITKTYTIEELSNGAHTRFKSSFFSHGQGAWHSDMFRIQRNGKNYLIKTLYPGTDGFNHVTENGKLDFNDLEFERHLFGYFLGEQLGAPQITRAGRFRNPDGAQGHFIEMEELFVNDRSTFTYKGLRKTHNILIQKFGFRLLSKAHIKSIAKLLIQALENGIFLDDLDFILSLKSDEVRWIDTTHWYINYADINDQNYWLENQDPKALINPGSLTYPRGSDQLQHIRTLFRDLHTMRKSYAKELWFAVNEEIEKSQLWSDQQKNNMKKNFRYSLNQLPWFEEEMGCELYLTKP